MVEIKTYLDFVESMSQC